MWRFVSMHVHFIRLAGWVRIGVFSAGWRYPTGLIPGVRTAPREGEEDGHRDSDGQYGAFVWVDMVKFEPFKEHEEQKPSKREKTTATTMLMVWLGVIYEMA